MNKKNDVELSADLQKVQAQFANWRRTRQGREPIPEELWQSVKALSKTYSIGEISKSLKLSHSNVKKHVLNSVYSTAKPPLPPVDFVELGIFEPPSSSSCILEMTNTKGSSLKINITGTPCIDVKELTNIFWSKDI